jgi:superfamily I DNA and/or RNA helicase
MTVGILSFYKAQITRLKAECYNLPGVTVVDGNEHLSPITAKIVDSAQSAEFDIVLLSLVRTARPAFLAERHRLVVALTRAKWMLGIYTSWSLVQERHSQAKIGTW